MLRNENLCFCCAPGHFRQSNPKWTSPRITFAKATRNGPRLGSLSPKQPEMDLAPAHFRQSCPKWTSAPAAAAKVERFGKGGAPQTFISWCLTHSKQHVLVVPFRAFWCIGDDNVLLLLILFRNLLIFVSNQKLISLISRLCVFSNSNNRFLCCSSASL